MDYKLVSLIMMIMVFMSYVSFIWIRYGILKSISASYYVLPEKSNYLFTLFCWGFALPAIILGDSLLMFLAGSAICFVGAAAQLKDKMTFTVHLTCAIIGITLSQASIFFDHHMWWVNIFFIVSSLIIIPLSPKHKIWWIEIVAYSSICYVLGSKLF